MDIKICGLTNLSDALAALEAGADFLGFVLYPPSPRGISTRRLRQIADKLPPEARTIGVFVNEQPETIARTVSDCGLFAVQLHGDEKPEDFRDSNLTIWRAVRIGTNGIPAPAPSKWQADRCVIDAAAPGLYGGTGLTADWKAAAQIAARYPAMLAGGLTPDNVADAIRAVRPMGVDVAGGVESVPGQKDHARLKAFITAARM